MRIKKTVPISRFVLIIATIVLSVGYANAQTGTVIFSGTHITTGKAIAEIQAQSPYVFAFNRQFDTGQPVRFTQREMPIKEALAVIADSGRFKTMAHNNYIVIVPDSETPKDTNASRLQSRLTSDVYRRTDPSNRHVDALHRPDQATADDAYEIERIVTMIPAEPVVRNYPTSYSDYHWLGDDLKYNLLTPRLAVKTNLLYAAAALTPNLSVELGTAPRQTLELSGSYSWRGRTKAASANHKQSAHLLLRPEYRWWTCERFNGHFFGAHALYSRYYISGHDVPLLFDKAYSYDGWALGAGITYGYHWAIGKRWGVEFNIGAGYAYLNYDRGTCSKCDPLPENKHKHYIGPTRAGIHLVYLIR